MDIDLPPVGSGSVHRGGNGNGGMSGQSPGGGGTPSHFRPSGTGSTSYGHGRVSPSRSGGGHDSARASDMYRHKHDTAPNSGGKHVNTGTPSGQGMTGSRSATGSSKSPTRSAQKAQTQAQTSMSAYAQAHTVRDGLVWDDHREDAKKMQSSFQIAMGPGAPFPTPTPPRRPPPYVEEPIGSGPPSVLRPPRPTSVEYMNSAPAGYPNGVNGPAYGDRRADPFAGGARPRIADERYIPNPSTPNYVPRNGNSRGTPTPAQSMYQADAARNSSHRPNAHSYQPRETPTSRDQPRSTTPISPPPPGATARTILRSAPNAKPTYEERRQMDAHAQRRQMPQSRHSTGAVEGAHGDDRRLSNSDHYNPPPPELQELPKKAGAPRGVKGPRAYPQKPREKTDKGDKFDIKSEAGDTASGTRERASHAGSSSPRATYESSPYRQRSSRGPVHQDDHRDGQRGYPDDPASKRVRQHYESNGHQSLADGYPRYYGEPPSDRRGNSHDRALQTTIMGQSIHGMASSRMHSFTPVPPPIHVPPPPRAQPAAHAHDHGAGSSKDGQRSDVPVEGDEMVREADAGMQAYASKGSIQASGRGSVSGRAASASASKIAGSRAGAASGTDKEAAVSEPAAAAVGVSASGKSVKMSTGIIEKNGTQAGKRPRGKKQEDIPNQDFCSSCRGIGKFLCCDGCPRSFHFMCLDPPLRVDELPAEETWYCKKCRAERAEEVQPLSASTTASDITRSTSKLASRPLPQTFKLLCRQMDEENPAAFRLPSDITTFFAGVAEDARGNYVDHEEPRNKNDRRTWQEDREGLRLTDRRSRPIACYYCGGTSFPKRGVATDPGAAWRPIASCDYCALHWHLDCLTPALATMPPAGRKWMCPNHVEQVMPRKRTIRGEVQVREVAREGMRNNGNVEVVEDDSEDEGEEDQGDSEDEEGDEEAEYDGPVGDVMINKRKYKVPEKIIQMDFVSKVRARSGTARSVSVNASTAALGDRKSAAEVNLSDVTLEDLDAASLILGIFGKARPLAVPDRAGPAESAKSKMTQETAKEAEPEHDQDMDIDSDMDLDMEMNMDMDADIENATFARMVDSSKTIEQPKASSSASTGVPVAPVTCEVLPDVSANPSIAKDTNNNPSTPTPVGPVERWVPRASTAVVASRPASPAVVTNPSTPSVPAALSGTLAKMQTDSYAPISSYRSPKPPVAASSGMNGTALSEPGMGTNGDIA